MIAKHQIESILNIQYPICSSCLPTSVKIDASTEERYPPACELCPLDSTRDDLNTDAESPHDGLNTDTAGSDTENEQSSQELSDPDEIEESEYIKLIPTRRSNLPNKRFYQAFKAMFVDNMCTRDRSCRNCSYNLASLL